MSDSSHFFTASRDKTVGVWGQDGEGGWVRKAVLGEVNEVTAVAVTEVNDGGGCGDSDKDRNCVLLATGKLNQNKYFKSFSSLFYLIDCWYSV